MGCPLCLSDFIDARVLRCGHAFCRGCIERHLADAQDCPICRHQIGFGRGYLRKCYALDSTELSGQDADQHDEYIETLYEEIDERDETITELGKKIKEKDAKITTLEKELKQKIEERDMEIKALEDEVKKILKMLISQSQEPNNNK